MKYRRECSGKREMRDDGTEPGALDALPFTLHVLRSKQSHFPLGLIGLGSGRGPTMGAQIFVQIPTGQYEEKALPGRSRGLTFRTKKQGRPQRFKLARIFLWNRRPSRPHTRRLPGTTGEWWNRHKGILAKPPDSVKKVKASGQSEI